MEKINISKISELSTQDEVATWQKLLQQTLTEILANDITEVLGTNQQKCLEVCLQFTAHTISTKSQLFMYVPSNPPSNIGLNVSDNADDLEEKQLRYGTAYWVLSHVLCLLSNPLGACVHKQARSVVTYLLNMAKLRDPYLFRLLAEKLVFALNELAAFDVAFYDNDADVSTIPHLTCFPATEKNLTPKKIPIPTPQMNQQLQVNISMVLSTVAPELGQFTPDLLIPRTGSGHPGLWHLIGQQLELGDIDLKIVSLNLLAALFSCDYSPSAAAADYILSCLVALSELLLTESDLEDKTGLETALTEVVQVTTPPLLPRLVHSLLHALSIHGILHLSTPVPFCDAVAAMATNVSISLDIRLKVIEKLVDTIGLSPHPQHVACLLRVILTDDQDLMQPFITRLEHLTKRTSQVCITQTLEGIRWILEVMTFNGGQINSDLVKAVLSIWSKFLLEFCPTASNSEMISHGFTSIVFSVGCLLVSQVSSQYLQEAVWMVSLPWMANELSWHDMKPTHDGKQLAALSAKIAETIDSSTIAHAVHAIGMMPKEVACKWRAIVFKMAFADTSADVRCGAVRGFPFFLHHSGPNTSHMIKSDLHSCVVMGAEDDLDLQLEIANIVGPLACVNARSTVIQQQSRNMKLRKKEMLFAVKMKCKVCDGDCAEQANVDSTLFLPFLKLLSNQHPSLKQAMIRGCQAIFTHLRVNQSSKILLRFLEFMQDSSLDVRRDFSEVIHHMVKKGSELHEVENVLVSHLRGAAKSAKHSANVRLRETVLITVGNIARVAEGNLLLVAIVILLDSICSPSCPLISAVAHSQLRLMAENQSINMRHMFLQFGRSIAKVLVDQMEECLKVGSSDPVVIIENVSAAFEFDESKNFLRRTEHLLLPLLVKKSSPESSQLIKLIAKLIGDPNHKGPLARNTAFIYSHLVCNCCKEELARALTFLEAELDWDLGTLLRQGENVDSELLLHLGGCQDQVLTGLKIWVSKVGLKNEVTDRGLVDILEPKLLGILVHFDNHLNNATVPIDEKKAVYESVICLMRFMGSEHISRVRIRLMTTLKIGLKFQTDGFPQLCCSAWDCFVHMLDSSALGPLLSQIVVGLLPLLKTAPLDAAKIFTFLIIENRNSLEPFFYELYFMPDIPELEEINSVLNKVLHGRSRDVKTQFQFLVKGVSHESPEVRLLALSKLFNLLQENQSAIHQMLLGSESVDPVISQMVNTLLHGCREADPKIRTLYGKCLGELGAIDPGRLERVQSVKSGELTKFQASVTDFNFAFEYVNELGKAFLRAEDRNTQDCVAFAIQELIQLFGIKDEARSSEPGALLWRRFPDDLKEILVPLKTSRYVLNVKIDWSKLSKPIYLSRKGTNFSTWVCTLTGYLSSKIREEKVKRVFDCSRGVIRNDSQVALYLLPYVIVHVLTEGADADRDQISEEVLAVLQQLQLPDAPSQLTSDPSAAPSDLSHMAAQTVFSVLDHLQKWMHHRIMLHSAKATRRHAGYAQKLSADAEHQRIECFLGGVPQDILAYASYRCGAFTRSLRHWERHMRLTQGSQSVPPSNQHLDFLQKLYVALEEVDGVAGVMALKVSTPSLDEQILTYESSGQLTDASMCYDQAIQLRPLDLSLRQGLLKCRLALGELQSALDLCNGVLAGQSSWSNCLNAFRVEASWKLGQWDDLNMYLKTETHSRDWNVGIGQLLLAVKSRDEETFIRQLEVVRNDLMIPLSAASMEAGSYHRGYKYITRLHMLSEVQHAAVTLMHWKSKEIGVRSSIHALQNVWHDRLQITQAAYRTQEPILNLRRVLLSLADSVTAQRHIGQCWLQSAKIARKSGLLQTAHSSLLSANQFQTAEFSLEKAKWFWDRGEHDQAQSCLEKSLQEHFPNRTDLREKGNECEEYTQKRILCARVLLQLARYYEETASCESNTIVLMYREVKNIHEKWEDVHFHTAKYYDKMMSAIGAPEQQSEFVIQVVNHFGMSLQYGNQFIYQSMPRMLSLWLDFGSEESTHRSSETSKQMVRATLKRLNKLMSHFSQKLSPYQFLTALPQLTSRICHTDADVFYQLKQIIGQLLVAFPQQTMWMLMAVSKSSFPMRIKRCQEIFNLAKTINRGLSKFLNDSTKLTEKLLDLCNKPYEIGRNTLSISHHFKPLLRLVEDNHFSQILIPLERLMTPTLPVVAMPTGSHDPFPSNQLFISGIEDTVEILPSLQKPKKLTLRGSDGRLYIVLCKPKDDLRKDARLMEFNGLINKCLRKDAEARRRGLYIRTYSVIPLNEECGILEWVNHVHGLRNILLKIYKERGLYTPGSELKQMQLPPDASIDQKLSVFKNKLLVRHPAVFSEWFLQTFPDPTSWYNARLSYCRTTAVMSLAGYILGLGDRHGENFNVDATSGDCVHVDFNCLFNKGETFEYPEVVPFRLTHNMVEAMGPLKTEGIFRRSCEVTMRVMRDQNDPLMSVLKTFIYDPLVEWNKPARGKSNESGEIKNEKAQTHVNNIEARLKGKLKNKTKPWGLPLSVDGHCKHLIKEATDEKNLCCMYIGWSAYM